MLMNNKKETMIINHLQPKKVLPKHLHCIIPQAEALGNAIEALYHLDELPLSDDISKCTETLKTQCASLIKKIAASTHNKETALSLRYRAKSMTSLDPKAWLRMAYEMNEDELILLCGKLSTWVKKSVSRKFSFIMAAPNKRINQDFKNLFPDIKQLESKFSQFTDIKSIEIHNPCAFQVCDLAFCSGEANTFPKHFSYFLPEDEGLKYSEDKKTIVFANIYLNRFLEITQPIAKSCIKNFSIDISKEELIQALLFWMRSHDIGHFAKTPQTNYKTMRKIGYFNSMSAQELIADCFGYQSTLSDSPLISKISKNTKVNLLLAELLRYASRKTDQNPDANSSIIILSYLISNGHLKLDKNKLMLSFDPEAIHQGFTQLTKEFAPSYFSSSAHQIWEFMNFYLKQASTENVIHMLEKHKECIPNTPIYEYYDVHTE